MRGIKTRFDFFTETFYKYQPSDEGGTRSLPAMPNRLQNPKWPPGGPKMAITPSMRKGRDRGGKNGINWVEKNKKRLMKIVAITSLPAIDRPNADRWNAARSRQYLFPPKKP